MLAYGWLMAVASIMARAVGLFSMRRQLHNVISASTGCAKIKYRFVIDTALRHVIMGQQTKGEANDYRPKRQV